MVKENVDNFFHCFMVTCRSLGVCVCVFGKTSKFIVIYGNICTESYKFIMAYTKRTNNITIGNRQQIYDRHNISMAGMALASVRDFTKYGSHKYIHVVCCTLCVQIYA